MNLLKEQKMSELISDELSQFVKEMVQDEVFVDLLKGIMGLVVTRSEMGDQFLKRLYTPKTGDTNKEVN